MRAGIMTLHSSYSYGASLQAYATWQALRAIGCEAEFIHYTNANEANQKSLLSVRKDFSALQNVKTTLMNAAFGLTRYQRRAFDAFHAGLPLSARAYSSLEALSHVDAYDVLVSGSDQLWNPSIFGGIDLAYFLGFGEGKKIAYAASAGGHRFTDAEKEAITPLLRAYHGIGVREAFLQGQVRDMVGHEVPVVVDPTLLFDGAYWRTALSPSIDLRRERYLLVYMIGIRYQYYKEHYVPIIEHMARQLGVKIYAVTNARFPYAGCDKRLCGLTPADLLHAIDHAALVISSSYHGIAFSLNLGRPFLALPNVGNTKRMEQLLETVGLEDRVVPDLATARVFAQCDPGIDYPAVHARLRAARERSRAWLEGQIND